MKKIFYLLFACVESLHGKYDDCTFDIRRSSDKYECKYQGKTVTDFHECFNNNISFNPGDGFLTFCGGDWGNIDVRSDSRVNIQSKSIISCDTFNIVGSFYNFGTLCVTNAAKFSGNSSYNCGNIFVGSANIELGKKKYSLLEHSSVDEACLNDINDAKNEFLNCGVILSDSISCRNIILRLSGKASYICANKLQLENSTLRVDDGGITVYKLIYENSMLKCDVEQLIDCVECYNRTIYLPKAIKQVGTKINDISEEFSFDFEGKQFAGRKITAQKMIDYLTRQEIINYYEFSDENLIGYWKDLINDTGIQDHKGKQVENEILKRYKQLLIELFTDSLGRSNDRKTVALFLMANEYYKKEHKESVRFRFINNPFSTSSNRYPLIVLNNICLNGKGFFVLDENNERMLGDVLSGQYVFVHEIRHAIHQIFGLSHWQMKINEYAEMICNDVKIYLNNILLKQLFLPFYDDLNIMFDAVLKQLDCEQSDEVKLIINSIILFAIFSDSEEVHNMYGIYYDYRLDKIILDELNDASANLWNKKPIRWTHLHYENDFKAKVSIFANDIINTLFVDRTITVPELKTIGIDQFRQIIFDLINYNKPGVKNPFSDIQAYMPKKPAIEKLIQLLQVCTNKK